MAATNTKHVTKNKKKKKIYATINV